MTAGRSDILERQNIINSLKKANQCIYFSDCGVYGRYVSMSTSKIHVSFPESLQYSPIFMDER